MDKPLDLPAFEERLKADGVTLEDADILIKEVVRWRWEATELLKSMAKVKTKGDKSRVELLVKNTEALLLHTFDTHLLRKDLAGQELAIEVIKALGMYGVHFPLYGEGRLEIESSK